MWRGEGVSNIKYTERTAIFDVTVVTFVTSMASDLFSQQAEFFQDFPPIHETLFGLSPGDPPPGPHCLSGHHDLEAVRHEDRLQIHKDSLQEAREASETTLTKFFLIKSFLHLSRLLGRDWDLLSEETLCCLHRDRGNRWNQINTN